MKASYKSFSMKFLENNNFLNNFFIVLKSFLVSKRNRLNTISGRKFNTVHLKYTTLLLLQQQSQDLSLLLLHNLDCLTLLSLDLLVLYNELVMLSFPSFPFIDLFLQVFWSKFEILFTFFSKKTNHFLTKPSTLFLFPVSLSSCLLRFHVSRDLSIAFFFLISWALFFFVFDIKLSFLSIYFGLNLSVKSSRSSYLWLLVFFLTCTFSWR